MKFFSKLLHDWNFRHIKIFRLGSHSKRNNLLIQKNLICNKTVCCRHYSSIRKSFDLPPISKRTLNKNTVLGLVIPENSNKILYIPLDYNDSLQKYVLNTEVLMEHVQNIENVNFVNDTVDIVKFVQRKNNSPNRTSIKDINFKNKNEITKKKLNKNTNLKATSIISLKYMLVDDLRKVVNANTNENEIVKDGTISFKSQFKGEIFIKTDELEESNKKNNLETNKKKNFELESKKIESIENVVLTTSETKSTYNNYAKTIDFNTFYYDDSKSQWGEGVEKKVITDKIKKARSHNRYSLSKKSNFGNKKRKKLKIQFINTNKVKPKIGDIVKALEIMSSKPENVDPDITIGNLEIDKSKTHSSIENDDKKEVGFIHKTDFEQQIPNQSETEMKINEEHDSKDWFEKLLVTLRDQSSAEKDIEQKKAQIEEKTLQQPKPKIFENKKIVKVHNKLETLNKDQIQNEIKNQQILDLKLELSKHPIFEKINSIEEESPKETKSKASNKNEDSFKIDSIPEQFSEEIDTSNKIEKELKNTNLQKLDSKIEESKYSNLSEITTKEHLAKETKSEALNQNKKELIEHSQSPLYLSEEHLHEKSDSPSNRTERELKGQSLPKLDSKFKKSDSSDWNKIDCTEQQVFKEIKSQKLNQNKKDLKEQSQSLLSNGYEVYILEEQPLNEINSKLTDKNKKELKVGNLQKESSLKSWNWKKISSGEEQSSKETRSVNKNLQKQHSNVQSLKQWNWKKINSKEEPASSNMQKPHTNLQPSSPWNLKKINSGEEQSSKDIQFPRINKNEKALKLENIKKQDSILRSSKSTDWNKTSSIEEHSSKKFKPQSLNRIKKEFKRKNLEVEELRRLALNKDNIRDPLGHTEKPDSKPKIPKKSGTTNKEKEKKNNNLKNLEWLDILITTENNSKNLEWLDMLITTEVKPEEPKKKFKKFEKFEKEKSQINDKTTSSQNKTENNKQSPKELNSQQLNKNENESLELEQLRTQSLTKTNIEYNSQYNLTTDLEPPITSKPKTQPENDFSIIVKEIKSQDYNFEPVEIKLENKLQKKSDLKIKNNLEIDTESITKNNLQIEENKSRSEILEKPEEKTESQHFSETQKPGKVIKLSAETQKPELLELKPEQLNKTKRELSIESSKLNQLQFQALVRQIKMIEANEKPMWKDENQNTIENKRTLCEDNLNASSNDKVFYNHKIITNKTESDTKSDQNLIEDQNLINKDHLTNDSENLDKEPEGAKKVLNYFVVAKNKIENSSIPTEIVFKDKKNTSDEISKNKNLNNTKPNISNNLFVIFGSKQIDISESTNVKDESEVIPSLKVEEDEVCENAILNEYNNIQLMASNILTNIVFNEIFPTLRSSVTDDHNKEDNFSDLNEFEKTNKIPIPRIDLKFDQLGEPKIKNKKTFISKKNNRSKAIEHMKTIQSYANEIKHNANKHKESLLLKGILLNTLLNNNVSSTSSSSSSTATASNENDCTYNEKAEPPNVDCSPCPNCSTIPPASCSKDKEKTAILCFRDNACSSKKSESMVATNQDDDKCDSK